MTAWQTMVRGVKAAAAAVMTLAACAGAHAEPAAKPGGSQTILNVSFDPTRELYSAVNAAFTEHWRSTIGGAVSVRQSHGGSGKQARAVIDGLEADVVTLALAYDIDVLHEKAGLVPKDWATKLPHNSAPYTSTIVFLVRSGNPKGVKDWGDLTRAGLGVVSANPKTSGGARWNYLAAYGYALRTNGGDHDKAKQFVADVFRNVAVLDTGARGSTNTFVQRGAGDVLIGWESDALLVQKEFPKQKLEIVYPSVTIKAEPAVAVVEQVARKRGTLEVATEYLKFLYTDRAQQIIVDNYFRPVNEKLLEANAERFKPVPLFTVDEVFGGWVKAQREHFDDGGVFDQIQAKRK